MPTVVSTGYADRLASRWVPPAAIFHGWTGNCLTCIKRAREHGSVIMIERATRHPSDWREAVLQECETIGVRPQDCRANLLAPLVRRMEREFELADAILVPSRAAHATFVSAVSASGSL
jgi:hypothetical protein